mmetsp:Transcript_47715/g.124991  ORF Transcript_47715/g.124991 Transcript_47715/m.124991 type:complete len:304 (-) Transcript_47715:172-1083(-)
MSVHPTPPAPPWSASRINTARRGTGAAHRAAAERPALCALSRLLSRPCPSGHLPFFFFAALAAAASSLAIRSASSASATLRSALRSFCTFCTWIKIPGAVPPASHFSRLASRKSLRNMRSSSFEWLREPLCCVHVGEPSSVTPSLGGSSALRKSDSAVRIASSASACSMVAAIALTSMAVWIAAPSCAIVLSPFFARSESAAGGSVGAPSSYSSGSTIFSVTDTFIRSNRATSASAILTSCSPSSMWPMATPVSRQRCSGGCMGRSSARSWSGRTASSSATASESAICAFSRSSAAVASSIIG